MKILERFSSKAVDQFAKDLAQGIAKRYPPSLDQSKEKKISHNRVSRILEETYAKAIAFHAENKLGVYRKARLGNTFRWELNELGYSKEFVELATEGLVIYVTRSAKTPPADPAKPDTRKAARK